LSADNVRHIKSCSNQLLLVRNYLLGFSFIIITRSNSIFIVLNLSKKKRYRQFNIWIAYKYNSLFCVFINIYYIPIWHFPPFFLETLRPSAEEKSIWRLAYNTDLVLKPLSPTCLYIFVFVFVFLIVSLVVNGITRCIN